MTYYLLWNQRTNRMMIDDRVHDGWEVQNSVEADNWIKAKKKFGFEFTSLQKEILDAKDDRAEISRRVVRHVQNAWSQLRPTHVCVQNRIEASLVRGFYL